MMRVNIDINGDHGILDIFVVRTKPTKHQPKVGELCDYELYSGTGFYGETSELLTEFQFPYGDGVQLAIEMLEVYQSVLEFEGENDDSNE